MTLPAHDKNVKAGSTGRLVVVGGGAAGFFCAVNAARLNHRLEVILLEKTGKLLSKVRVSGGGRCNVTHDSPDIEAMIEKYPRGARFLRNSFHHFFKEDTVRWFSERGVRLKTEPDGRMFPVTNSSQSIIDCLLSEAHKYAVSLRLHSAVKWIETRSARSGDSNHKSFLAVSDFPGRCFRVWLGDDENIDADFVCVCCGGFPKMEQYEWIARMGHSIVPPVPSLFTFNIPGHSITRLQGVSVSGARIRIQGTSLEEKGPLLITHWGLSGPAILRMSAWAARDLRRLNYHCTILVNWNPDYNEKSADEKLLQWRLEKGTSKTGSRNEWLLPERLWRYILEQAGISPEQRWADLSAPARHQLVRNLCSMPFEVSGKTTFKEEFVAAGGIHLGEINPHTMESRKQPGLYLAGEIMDVDGITGGFNFQHAWTSGYLAARSIASQDGTDPDRGY